MSTFVLIERPRAQASHTLLALKPALETFHANLVTFHDLAEASSYLKQSSHKVSLVICEPHINGSSGIEFIQQVSSSIPEIVSLIISDSTDAQIAIQAVQAGAYDVLPQPLESSDLLEVLSQALPDDRSPQTPKEETSSTTGETKLIGKSRAMAKVYRDIGKLAPTPVTILIRGETGTGKELIARALHENGHRSHGKFVTVNCAAIPDALLESELFGHEKGAFTGAHSQKIGKFEQAHGATLFLDEIGDMQPTLQAKMLRVLQERTIHRVGGKREIPVDVRIIAATHQNLEQMVDKKLFRADLLYRLSGYPLKVPPLRDRLGDVQILARHFLNMYGRELKLNSYRITPEALAFLSSQPWPGNVRQLQNIIYQALIRQRELTIDVADLQSLDLNETAMVPNDSLTHLINMLLVEEQSNPSDDGVYKKLIHEVERQLIPRALELKAGNITHTSKVLGLTRATLREKIRHLALT